MSVCPELNNDNSNRVYIFTYSGWAGGRGQRVGIDLCICNRKQLESVCIYVCMYVCKYVCM